MRLRTVRYICTGLLGVFILLVLITAFTNDPVYTFIGFIPVIASFIVMYRYWRCPNCGARLRGLVAGSKGLRHCESCGEEIDLDGRPGR